MAQQGFQQSIPIDRSYNVNFLSQHHGAVLASPALEDPSNFLERAILSQSQLQDFVYTESPVFYRHSGLTYESIPLLDLYPTKLNSPRQMKTPVMHPNLVCTLKSILSPRISLDFDNQITSRQDIAGDSTYTESGISQRFELGKVQQFVPGHSHVKNFTSKSCPRNIEWSSMKNLNQTTESGRKHLEHAVLVSVDLIQNKRPYQCKFTGCQRTFKNPQTMKMHHKTHSNDVTATRLGGESLFAGMPGSPLKAGHNKKIPSRCPTCNKTFVGLYELRRHFGRKHSEGEKSHVCRKCGKRFHIEVDVRDHEKLCGKPISCTCGMRFAFKCNLVAHKRSHPKCNDRPVMEVERVVQTSNPFGSSIDGQVEDGKGKRESSESGVRSPSCTISVSNDLARYQSLPAQPLFDCVSYSPLPLGDSSLSTSPLPSLTEAVPSFNSNGTNVECYNSSLLSQILHSESRMRFPIDQNMFAAFSRPLYQEPQRQCDFAG